MSTPLFQVTITTRQLMSHLSGIRHYDKTCKKKKSANDVSHDYCFTVICKALQSLNSKHFISFEVLNVLNKLGLQVIAYC